MNVTLPDGTVLDLEAGATGGDAALAIGEGLARAALAIEVNGELRDLARPLDDQRLGLFSYGSGCMAEFFSGIVQRGHREHLFTDQHRAQLDTRVPVTYRQYEDIFNYGVPKDGADHVFAPYRGGPFRLAGIKDHKRRYEAK